MVIVRARGSVLRVCTTESFSGISSFAIVVVPSPQDANASCDASSKAQPSTPAPIGTVANTLPVVGIESARKVLDPSLPSNDLINKRAGAGA